MSLSQYSRWSAQSIDWFLYFFFERNFKSFLEFYMSDGYPPVSPGATILTKPVPTQGFIEVDTAASPEEKHVANMQINGWLSFKYN